MEIERLRRSMQHHLPWGVVLVFVLGGFALLASIEYGLHADIKNGIVGEMSSSSLPIAAPLPASEPVSLSIPALALETTFSAPLGLNPDNSIAVPTSYTEVGWYSFGPTPGELGPSVVLGHVDSYQGPAVFFPLGQLVPGDDIFVTRADGSVAHFRVMALERTEQSTFPTQAVYGDIEYPGLRLVTCSGIYQKGVQRYTHNLIVYAALVPA